VPPDRTAHGTIRAACLGAALAGLALTLAACNPGGPTNGPTNGPTTDPPQAPALTFEVAGIKILTLTWNDVEDETEYRVLHDPTSTGSYDTIATLPADAITTTLDVFIPAAVTTSYVVDACNAGGCSRSQPVSPGDALDAAIGYLKATNTGADDWFGSSVALSADGTTLAVGAPFEDGNATGVDGDQDDDSASNSGAVYVYVRAAPGAWTLEAYVKATNTGADDWFGSSVALSADGTTLAVGAPGEDSNAIGVGGDQTDNTASNSGAVYLYTRDASGTWTPRAYVKATNTDADDGFGSSVALSADGTTLAVGTPFEDSNAIGVDGDGSDNSALSSGAVYVYVRDGTDDWSHQAYIKATNTDPFDFFGSSVALSVDGTTLAAGALLEASGATGVDGDQDDDTEPDSGAVYVYTRDTAGTWTLQAYIKATNTDAGDEFGQSVALSADGTTLAVGAHGEASGATGVDGDQDDDTAGSSGAVYLYTRDATGTWSPQAYVKATNTDASDWFGYSVALTADGTTLAVSAYGEGSNATGVGGDQDDDSATRSGAVYTYVRDHAGVWTPQAYLKATNAEASDWFGYRHGVALSADGTTLAVGAPREDSSATGISGDQDDNTATDSGAVYLY
jgi:hypothetical protein